MKRNATLLQRSANGRKAVYVDDDNYDSILEWMNEHPSHKNKFWMIVELVLNGRPTRDLYDTEEIDKTTEHVTAMKPFKGKKNPRIYCQQYTDREQKIYVIVAAELLPKKTTNGKNSKKEIAIIKRVASYNYTLHDEKSE